MRGPTLRILSFNDVYVLENLPRWKTLVRQHAAEAPADATLVVLAGDFLAPSLLSSLDGGRGMVDCLNDVGVTHVILGNHEDDIPATDLRARLHELRACCLGTNLRGFDPPLPVSDMVDLGGDSVRRVRVGLVGIVMSDLAVYRGPPFGGAELLPANPAAMREAARLVSEHGCGVVVPITHQPLADDRALAQAWSGSPLPLIVGGHEHVVMVERSSGTCIVKAGSDATHAAIIDLVWALEAPADGRFDAPTVTVRTLAVADYPEDARLRARVDAHMAKVHALEHVPLMSLAPGETLSSVGVRVRQTSMGTLICSRLRDALAADVCLFNAGGIRAGRDYTGTVTYGDLKTEVPFENEVVVVRMSGRVIREAVAASRAHAPEESGGFLQVDDRTQVTLPGHRVTKLAGVPLDDDGEYRVALVRNLLDGMDHVLPLAEFAKEHPEKVPPHGAGSDVKVLLVDAFARALWTHLGGFDAVDANHDGRVTEDEIADAVGRLTHGQPSSVAAGLVLHAIDGKRQGAITPDEVDDARSRSPPGGKDGP